MGGRFSRPIPRGKLRGLAWGGLQAHSQWGLQAHTWGVSRPIPWGVSRPTPRGSPRPHRGGSPGPHPGGVSQHAQRQTLPQLTATAGSTHPTGMHPFHSCYIFIYMKGYDFCWRFCQIFLKLKSVKGDISKKYYSLLFACCLLFTCVFIFFNLYNNI